MLVYLLEVLGLMYITNKNVRRSSTYDAGCNTQP